MARKRKGKNPRKNAKKVSHNASQGNSDNRNDNHASVVTGAAEENVQAINRSADATHERSLKQTEERNTGAVLSGREAINPSHASTRSAGNASIHHASVRSGSSRWTRSALVQGTRAGKMPRPWFKKWGWWFLPLSLVGTAFGAWWGVRHIEGQVQAAAPEILKAAGVDPSRLTFDVDYRNIAVAGELPAGVTVDQVERILEEGTGASNEDIRYATVTAQEAPPEPEPVPAPEPEPIVVEPKGEISVAAVSDGQSITLSGSVPNQEHADRLLSTAAQAVGEDNVVNELNVLGLTPSAIEPEAQINRLAQVLPRLGSGITAANLALDDDNFSGSIDAIDTNAKEQIDPIVATASGNEVSVSAPVVEPVIAPPEVNVFTDYKGERIFLYGEVINDAQRQTLIDAAAESVGADNVLSTLKLLEPDTVSAASDSQVASLGDTLRRYRGLQSAESRLNASILYFRGVAGNNTAKETLDQSLQSGADAGLQVDGKVELISVGTELNLLQDEFDGLAGEIRENVVFATNSDILDGRATKVLDKVVGVIEKFDRPRIEVSGHTDSSGPAGKNQLLSARRAAAVLAYLTSKGVNVERLRAIGVGESQPIADNNTPAGRQQNRRVEFTAVERF